MGRGWLVTRERQLVTRLNLGFPELGGNSFLAVFILVCGGGVMGILLAPFFELLLFFPSVQNVIRDEG